MKKQLISFHGEQSIKDKYIARVKAHAEADEIIKGQYWENGKGCAIGCTIEGDEHKRYETELGIPESIAHLEDGIFEGLSNKEAMKFPLEFIEAIPVGADLSRVTIQFKIWLLMDKEHGAIQYANAQTKKVIKKIVALHKRELLGEEVDYSNVRSSARYAAESAAEYAEYAAWSSARSSAESAMSAAWYAAESAMSAAWSSAMSAAWSSERSSAESAMSAAKYAAWSSAEFAARYAAMSAAWSSARSSAESAMSAAKYAAWSAQKNKLLKLLRDAPVIN